jgi:hypothetical protein
MRFKEEDFVLVPVRDFAANSPFLRRLGWSSRLMAGLIRSGFGMEGQYDTNQGGWITSKHAIMEALLWYNKRGLRKRVDLVEAYEGISSERIEKRATG